MSKESAIAKALQMIEMEKAAQKPKKIKQTVTDPIRNEFSGIYKDPREIAAEAASRVAPESSNLKQLFGVNREDLYQMGKEMRGNLPGTLPGAAENPRGSAAAESIMNKKNVQRILDVNAEAENYHPLIQGMDPWYVMTPFYKRMVELLGPEKAAIEYNKINTLSGMASPGSEVMTEIPRGSAAYYLHKQERFPEFVNQLGLPRAKREAAGVASDIIDVPGHMYHKTAQAIPMERFLRTGELDMSSPKVPMYIEASGVPETGFQTQTPVGDAHWSRAVGLADVRGAKNFGASVSNPEMTQLAPWWRDKIASQLGIESVPAQARTWGAFSGQTGVTTPIGAPKLELWADQIAAAASRMGVSPETARDLFMTGQARVGKAEGGAVNLPNQSPETDALAQMTRDPQANEMLNLDLMRLAATHQPQGYAGGGITRSPEDSFSVSDSYPQFDVKHKRTYGSEIPQVDSSGAPISPVEQSDYVPEKDLDYMKLAKTLGSKLWDQTKEDISTMTTPQAYTDVLNKGFIAGNLGAPVDLINMGLQGVDWLSSKANPQGIPMGISSENPVGGSEWIKDKMHQAGMTSDVDRPVLEFGANFIPPTAATGAARGVVKGIEAAKPFATKVDDMVREMYEAGKIPQPGMSIKDVSRVLAPANEMGFYSPVEAAALNLQRKSGNGQAFLNDIMKGENVRPDEINTMGLDTFLKGKKDVTADEVRDYIANNKIQLGESVYAKKPSVYDFAIKQGLTEDEAAGVAISARNGDPKAIEVMNAYENIRSPKFSSYALPGGENYREVVLTLPSNRPSLKNMSRAEYNAAIDAADKAGITDYQSSHWEDTNPIAHLRMSDRVTDGKKTLLVDEVQSDWHQAGREHGYKTKDSIVAQKAYEDYAGDLENRYVAAIREEAPSIYLASDAADLENFVSRTVNQKSLKDMAKAFGEEDKYNSLYKDYIEIGKNKKGVPNAPFKDDWYQLALKRAIKEAIDNGYDRVALPTGQRVAERFDLSKQLDKVVVRKYYDEWAIEGYKGNTELFNHTAKTDAELADTIGKELAKKAIDADGGTYEGLDLKIGGEGMRKYYDEIYPGYLKKFGKKYGANVGTTQVEIPPKDSDAVLKYDGGQEYANGQITWKEFLQRSPQAAREFNEPLHYMDITPAMREAFKTGIHMKKGGKVAFADSPEAMREEISLKFKNKEEPYPQDFDRFDKPKKMDIAAAQLVPTQNEFVVKKIKHDIKNPDFKRPKVVYNHETGKYLIIDGHHRILSDLNRGEDKIPVKVVGTADLDAMKHELLKAK